MYSDSYLGNLLVQHYDLGIGNPSKETIQKRGMLIAIISKDRKKEDMPLGNGEFFHNVREEPFWTRVRNINDRIYCVNYLSFDTARNEWTYHFLSTEGDWESVKVDEPIVRQRMPKPELETYLYSEKRKIYY